VKSEIHYWVGAWFKCGSGDQMRVWAGCYERYWIPLSCLHNNGSRGSSVGMVWTTGV